MSNLNYKQISMPIVAAIAVVFGLYLGKYLYTEKGINKYNIDFTSNSSTHKIQRILDAVDNYYVDSINYNQIEEEVIASVLKQLDPHSVYIPAAKMQIENDRMEGVFGGIGVQFKIVKDTIVLLKIIKNGPAEKVGLNAGDKIIRVNDSLFAGNNLSIEKIIGTLRGEKGSKVNVGVLRQSDSLFFEITRGMLPIYSVDYAEILDHSVGYIKINRFSKTTMKEFKKATKNWNEDSLNGLIVDLRGNPGGLLEEVIELCDAFLPEGKMIVYTKDKYQTEERISTDEGKFHAVPLTVLIDEGSASASEIFAGSMQDNDRAVIIGRRSFGKGLVQRPFDLKDGSVLRLTIARYYTPVGRCIQRDYGENKSDYYNEISNRLSGGELSNKDSMVVTDSLKYITPMGNVVYGGGGIIPDLFVPIDSIKTDEKSNELLILIYQNALSELFAISQMNQLSKRSFGSMDSAYAKLTELAITEKYYEFLKLRLNLDTDFKNIPTPLKQKLEDQIITDILGYLFDEAGTYYSFLLKDRAVNSAKNHFLKVDQKTDTNLNIQP